MTSQGEVREEEVGHAFHAALERKSSWSLLTDKSLFPLPWKTVTKAHKYICHRRKIIYKKSKEDVVTR